MNIVPRYAGKILRHLKMTCFRVTETWDKTTLFGVGNKTRRFQIKRLENASRLLATKICAAEPSCATKP